MRNPIPFNPLTMTMNEANKNLERLHTAFDIASREGDDQEIALDILNYLRQCIELENRK